MHAYFCTGSRCKSAAENSGGRGRPKGPALGQELLGRLVSVVSSAGGDAQCDTHASRHHCGGREGGGEERRGTRSFPQKSEGSAARSLACTHVRMHARLVVPCPKWLVAKISEQARWAERGYGIRRKRKKKKKSKLATRRD